MRSFIVLLLLIVVFLTGMLFGMEKKESKNEIYLPAETKEIAQSDIITEWQVYEEQPLSEKEVFIYETPKQTTHKLAILLESGVKGFYEMVVELLYQISSVFI